MNFKVWITLALVALVFVLTATTRNSPDDEHAAKTEELSKMKNQLRGHIEELDSQIQQVKLMQENWHKRNQELDQRAHQLNAEHEKRMEELEAQADSMMKFGRENKKSPPENRYVHYVDESH